MGDAYRLQVKLGANEFSAEGPEEHVKEAYQQFLDAVATAPKPGAQAAAILAASGGSVVSSTAAPIVSASPIEREKLDRIYSQDARGIVSLRLLPSDMTNREADTAILILYGFRALTGQREVLVTRLNEGLRQSGINVDRVDRFLGVHSALFMRGGARSGGRYTLNNVGVQTAENWLRTWFE